MRTLAEVLRDGPLGGPGDVARIAALLAEQVRFGHDQGAVHGDLGPETVRVESRGADWAVHLDQPRAHGPSGRWRPPEVSGGASATGAADIYALGRIVEELTTAVPATLLPPSVSSAVRSMTAADPASRPSISQVALYFGEDLPTELAGMGGDETIAVPYQEPVSEADGRYTGRGADADEDERDLGYVDPLPAEERAGSRRAAIVVSLLVLALGLGALSFVLWRTLGGEERPVTAVQDSLRNQAEATEEEPTTDEEVATDAAPPEREETVEAQQTAEETVQAEGTAGSGGTEPTGTVHQDGEVGTGAQDTTTSGVSEESTTPAQPTNAAADHTDPDWYAHGWDDYALAAAYCRDRSSFIGLADTKTYRGVICRLAGDIYSYRGLNKAGNATLLSSASPTSRGWEAYGEGGVRYVFDQDTFTILDAGGNVLDEEDVTTWLEPSMTPFAQGILTWTSRSVIRSVTARVSWSLPRTSTRRPTAVRCSAPWTPTQAPSTSAPT
ncbi:hypothetical protein [Ornithinimicrobium sp. Y1694]|uniref:hypothetical protein n=1 Tax=Ornithinimicrobium sp. Y1694 TaxID=3418590 RepID=UPI003CFB0BDE